MFIEKISRPANDGWSLILQLQSSYEKLLKMFTFIVAMWYTSIFLPYKN